jgi:hypothetical protein
MRPLPRETRLLVVRRLAGRRPRVETRLHIDGGAGGVDHIPEVTVSTYRTRSGLIISGGRGAVSLAVLWVLLGTVTTSGCPRSCSGLPDSS